MNSASNRAIRECPFGLTPLGTTLLLHKIDWENQIGRRLKLRDLHVFSRWFSAAAWLRPHDSSVFPSPLVSEVIVDLEHALGVRLVHRSPQGVEPTIYGDALLRRSVAAFDELKQSIRDIEFFVRSDRGTGSHYGGGKLLWFTL